MLYIHHVEQPYDIHSIHVTDMKEGLWPYAAKPESYNEQRIPSASFSGSELLMVERVIDGWRMYPCAFVNWDIKTSCWRYATSLGEFPV